ncbi:hypothetical protein [Nocardia gipuzkoensis]|uniref:hypothetical protein n=1 Tax=Nocardia gipuzkoensis TaxID=2749991 RepID=UPI0015EE6C3E|nr:hypothetical protein [Nocardia gipuzkoensis]
MVVAHGPPTFAPCHFAVVEVEVELGLIDPIHQSTEWNTRVEYDIDEIRRHETLHVFDAFFDEPGFVPHVQAVDLAAVREPFLIEF